MGLNAPRYPMVDRGHLDSGSFQGSEAYFGDKTFYQISGVTLKDFIPTLVLRKGKKEGKPLSPSRIRNIFIPLRAIWYDACEEHRWDLSDPFAYIAKHLPRRTKNHPEVFRFDEWTRIIESMCSA